MQTKALFQREEGFLFYLVREAAGRAGKRCPIKRFSAALVMDAVFSTSTAYFRCAMFIAFSYGHI